MASKYSSELCNVNDVIVEENDISYKRTAIDDTDGGNEKERLKWSRWRLISQNYYYRQFIRAISLVNLFVLAVSLPWKSLHDSNDHSHNDVNSIQFICVTVIDFLLACLYTFGFVMRISYWWHLRQEEANKLKMAADQIPKEQEKKSPRYIGWFVSLGLVLIMWYSVAIGVYRSIFIIIPWQWYIPLVLRCILPLPPVIAMFSGGRQYSFFQRLLGILKWRQLVMVTVFYFIFVSALALMGVHIIGNLNHACVYKKLEDNGTYSIIPAHPFTHCNPNDTSGQFFCGSDEDEGLVCAQFPVNESALFFGYRSYVYYGQYTVILDALYAVYEASTLELWSFMMYAAIEGRGFGLPVLIYVFLTLFIVIILQQSMFLVVIIESFADFRSQSFFRENKSSVKPPSKPTTVLSIRNGSIEFTSTKIKSSVAFLKKYSENLLKFEKVFLVLVIVDAIFTATKHTGMNEPYKIFLQSWQIFASIAFVMEILLVFLFHFYHGQWKLFFWRPYNLCLIILAVGGIVAAIPLNGFYNPLQPGNGLAIFQALRFPRLLRLYKPIQDFAIKIMGKNIPILSVVTICLIVLLAVANAQIFGYKEVPQECFIDSNHFGVISDAFQATFQIVMNEAWTDVTSEVMCRSSYWFITNFYFIVIHLFSSLIFLNFFGAVILDNLEYDEEEKIIKLEKIKEIEEKFAETVPAHLTIYEKLNGKPKKLKVPPEIGKLDPNLEEMEIRRFFETASATDLLEDTVCHTTKGACSRESQNFGLSFDEEGMTAETPDKQIRDINSMLDYIKVWKQCNEEESSKFAHVSHVHRFFGKSSYDRRSQILPRTRNVRSTYDIYREKYEYFDKALFCMSREHRLRTFCTRLLTAQAKPPHNVPSDEKKGLLHLFRKRVSYIFQWIISRMTYSTWILFLGLCIVISVQMDEFKYIKQLDQLQYHTYTTFSEVLYLILMVSWLTLKVISQGCFLNPQAAISSLWDVIDWILVLDSALLFLLTPLWGQEFQWDQVRISIPYLDPWWQIMIVIRCLRPLHIISMYCSTRAIVGEIVKGWKNLVKANILMFGFIFMFASLGVQLFSGTEPNNPVAFCNDPEITQQDECVGEFKIEIETSREFLPLNNSLFPSVKMLVPRVWYPGTRDFSFNNVGLAFVTLFELLTLEGWPEVRDLFGGRNRETQNAYMKIYMHVFVFFAVNIGLQLFVGIVVNNFNEQKPGHTTLLTVDQNRWVELMQRITLQRPYKLPEEPRHNVHRRRLYFVLTSSYFRFIPTIITALSALTLVVPWNDDLIQPGTVVSLISLSIMLNSFSIVEMVLKQLAFGPAYFRSWRNNFDFVISFVTFLYCLIAGISLINPDVITHLNVSYFALVLVMAKLLTVLVKYSSMLNLLWTVMSTLISSLSLTIVIFVVTICYALVGVALFSNVRSGEAINYYLVNFKGTESALSALWRSLTGEDWYQIMWDAAVREPYCQDSLKNCGNAAYSILYFGSFTFIVPFILLNVFIAVLLENFSIFYNDEGTCLDRDVIKDFKNNWRFFDSNAKGNIPITRLKLLMRSLKLEGYYSYGVEEHGKRERKLHSLYDPLLLWELEKELRVTSHGQINMQTSSEVKVKFGSVLRMLAYRCEDINKRLEPQELFTRKELEQTLQLDVAQECIYKWMKKRVQPILKKLNKRPSLEQYQKVQRRGSATEKRLRFKTSQIQSRLDLFPEGDSCNSEDDSTVPAAGQLDQAEQTPCLQQSLGIENTNRKKMRFKNLHSAIHSKRHHLFPVGEGDNCSVNSEDEEGNTIAAAGHLARAISEEQIDCSYDGRHNEQFIRASCQSFIKLRQQHVSSSTGSSDEKVKQWFQIQEEWMENVKTDKNYFDDLL